MFIYWRVPSVSYHFPLGNPQDRNGWDLTTIPIHPYIYIYIHNYLYAYIYIYMCVLYHYDFPFMVGLPMIFKAPVVWPPSPGRFQPFLYLGVLIGGHWDMMWIYWGYHMDIYVRVPIYIYVCIYIYIWACKVFLRPLASEKGANIWHDSPDSGGNLTTI